MCWKLVVAFLFPGILLSQEKSPLMALTPFASYQMFGRSLGFDPALGYGFHLSFSPASRLAIVGSVSYSPTSVAFDLIGYRDRLDVSVTMYQIGASYALMTLANVADVGVAGRAGVMRFSREARSISLGALGSTSIPEQSESRSVLSTGLVLSRSLSRMISIYLSPELQFTTPVSNTQGNYSISGGLAIGIL